MYLIKEKVGNQQGKQKVIIDTDGGVDDATALLLAVADPYIEILAITTVTGNTHLRQVNINVLRTLKVVKAKVRRYFI